MLIFRGRIHRQIYRQIFALHAPIASTAKSSKSFYFNRLPLKLCVVDDGYMVIIENLQVSDTYEENLEVRWPPTPYSHSIVSEALKPACTLALSMSGIGLYRHFYRQKVAALPGAGDALGLRGSYSSASIVNYRTELEATQNHSALCSPFTNYHDHRTGRCWATQATRSARADRGPIEFDVLGAET